MGNIWAGQSAVSAPVQPDENAAAVERWWPLRLTDKGAVLRGFNRCEQIAAVSPAGAGHTYGFWPGVGPLELQKITGVQVRDEIIVCHAEVRVGATARPAVSTALFAWSLNERRCLWVHSTVYATSIRTTIVGDFVHAESYNWLTQTSHLQVLCLYTGAVRASREVAQTLIVDNTPLEVCGNMLTALKPDGTRLWQISLPREIIAVGPQIRTGDLSLKRSIEVHSPNYRVFVELETGRTMSQLRQLRLLRRQLPELAPPPCRRRVVVCASTSRRHVMRQLKSSCQPFSDGERAVEVCSVEVPGVMIAWMPPTRELARCECAAVDDAVAATDELNSGGDALGLVRAVLVAFMAEDARLIVRNA